ncbi:MAG TPA: S1 RNA-binding domain-containing protein [Vicinamibacterales bacterium]|nr:S1 RNA-binding domain-containing protein [Vicinamibacterales bacterium]
MLRVDEGRMEGATSVPPKIALSLKQLTEDPWATALVRYAVGQVYTGRVTRLAEFGAFVELDPGVEGLAHSSTFPPTGGRDDWQRAVPVGLTAPFEILSIDPDKKRIGVTLVPDGSTRATAAQSSGAISPGARLTGTVERHERFRRLRVPRPGTLMPLSETGVERDGDVAKRFPVGSDVEVIVLDSDPDGRRIRVSHKAVREAEEAAQLREYAARGDAAPAESFGSLADKLRGALRPNERG